MHLNIKFIYEVEKDHFLPFLDVNIIFSSGFFRHLFTGNLRLLGLFTNFDSFKCQVFKCQML